MVVALLHDHPPLTARGGGRQALLHAFASGQRGRGIGSNLLKYVHERLALAGYCSILVKIVGVEGPVHDWNRRLGYEVDLVIGFDYGGDRPWWVIVAAGESHAAIMLDDSLRRGGRAQGATAGAAGPGGADDLVGGSPGARQHVIIQVGELQRCGLAAPRAESAASRTSSSN